MSIQPGHIIYRSRDAALVVTQDRSARSLYFERGPVQSRMLNADPYALALSYTRTMMAYLLFREDFSAVLQLGLGGGSLAKFIWKRFPGVRIDAVEHSRDVVEVARRFFLLPEDDRLHLHVAEAGAFVNEAARQSRRYDVLLVDLFDAYTPSPLLTLPAFWQACRALLDDAGVLVVNLWAGTALRAALRAMQSSFDSRLRLLRVEGKGNVVALACDHSGQARPARAWQAHARALEARHGLELSRLARRLTLYQPAAAANVIE